MKSIKDGAAKGEQAMNNVQSRAKLPKPQSGHLQGNCQWILKKNPKNQPNEVVI